MTRDKLVERIARALWTLEWEPAGVPPFESAESDQQRYWRDSAVAALHAIESAGLCIVPREPTEGMIEAGEAVEGDPGSDIFGDPGSAPDAASVYRAMIAAAGEG